MGDSTVYQRTMKGIPLKAESLRLKMLGHEGYWASTRDKEGNEIYPDHKKALFCDDADVML